MAESVDALVSNTSGATHPGSIPGLGTKRKSRDAFPLLLFIRFTTCVPASADAGSPTTKLDTIGKMAAALGVSVKSLFEPMGDEAAEGFIKIRGKIYQFNSRVELENLLK